MEKKIVILGAGLSGAIMYKLLGGRATVIEKNPWSTQNHNAVLHFRNPELSHLLGLEFKKVKVQKEIYYQGHTYSEPKMHLNNLYSLKVNGILADKSIEDLSEKERWISTGGQSYNYGVPADTNFFDTKVTGIQKGFLFTEGHFAVGDIRNKIKADIIISTLPLPLILRLVAMNEDFKIKFEHKTIFNIKVTFEEGFSSVCQTLYFPDQGLHCYRATIDENIMTIESFSDELPKRQIEIVFAAFGLFDDIKYTFKVVRQDFGKIVSIPDDLRKAIIFELTDKFNIFSLGRFAIWKNIRTEEIYNDALQIKSMINRPESMQKYQAKKEAI